MSRTPARTLTAALALAGVATLSGCGTVLGTAPEKDPAEVVRTATDTVNDATQQRMTLSITATQGQLEAFARGPEGEEMTDEEFEEVRPALTALRGSTLTTQTKATAEGVTVVDAVDASETDSSLAWSIDGERLVEVVEVDEMDLYLRTDALGLMRAVGSEEGVQAVEDFQEQAESGGQDMAWLVDLIAGRWVGFDDALIEEAKTAAEDEADVDAEALTDEEQDRLRRSVLEHSDMTKLEDGRFEQKVHVKQVVEANRDLVDTMIQESAEAEGTPTDEVPTVDEVLESLNDGTFDMVHTIEDGRLTAVDLDPVQFADVVEPTDDADEQERATLDHLRGSTVPMHIEYTDQIEEITVPEGATRITEEDLSSLGGTGTATL